jgi:hypothetical protein
MRNWIRTPKVGGSSNENESSDGDSHYLYCSWSRSWDVVRGDYPPPKVLYKYWELKTEQELNAQGASDEESVDFVDHDHDDDDDEEEE